MISNDEQLALVREQLGRLEAVLQDLKDRVQPQSEKQFQLMSEIYVEHIDKLRREIDEYGAGRAGGRSGPARSRRGRPAVRRSA